MRREEQLAVEAILIGLRRAGAIDRRAIQSIVSALEETALKTRSSSPATADVLLEFARGIHEGPGRTCLINVTD